MLRPDPAVRRCVGVLFILAAGCAGTAEDVHFVAPGSDEEPGRVRLPARVTRVVPYGVPYRVELDAGVPIVGLAARHTVDGHRLTAGREVLVSFDVAAIHLVPP